MTGRYTGWQLTLTGGLELSAADGGQIRVSGKKAKGLLAILALSPGLSATRARIKSLLWSDRGEAQAGDSLRQLLTVLRKELADQACDVLHIRDDQVGLHAELLGIDADEITKRPAQTAASLYRGPLLDGLDIGDNQFEEWLATERSALQARMIVVLEQFCAETSGEARIATAKRLVALDPLREASHRALISAFLATEEQALAKKQLEALRQILERELGVKPSDDTLRLLEAPMAVAAAETAPQSARPAIAVQAFANLSGDAEQRYFSDGVSADIATELSRYRDFTIRAGRSVETMADPAQWGRAHGVNYVVGGSVRRLGKRIRISANLIDVNTSEQVWNERFDADGDSIFDLQDRIVQSIAAQMTSRLQVTRLDLARRKPPASLAAYEHLLQGDALPNGDDEIEEQARQHFAKAIEIDPGYARAHAYLGEYLMLGWLRDLDAPNSNLLRALATTTLAVSLDDNDYCCHALHSHVLLECRDYVKALHHSQRAVALNPSYVPAIVQLGFVHSYNGEHERGLELLEQARQINPHFEPSWYWRDRAIVQLLAGRVAEAVTGFKRSPVLYEWVEAYLAVCSIKLGQTSEARQHAANAMRLNPRLTVAKFLSREPFRQPEDNAAIADAMHQAGIPG